eukprot:4304892-Prymnesium_polylepis.1
MTRGRVIGTRSKQDIGIAPNAMGAADGCACACAVHVCAAACWACSAAHLAGAHCAARCVGTAAWTSLPPHALRRCPITPHRSECALRPSPLTPTPSLSCRPPPLHTSVLTPPHSRWRSLPD